MTTRSAACLEVLALPVLVTAIAASSFAQAPSAPAVPTPSVPVIGVDVEVVQVDAVVTDKSGRYVTDLTAGDFEIVEDGRKQAITNFSYIDLEAPLRAELPPAPMPTSSPLRPLRPEQVRRTMVIVLDDWSLGFEDYLRVRRMLGTFVDEQMQPGDLVSIVRADGGVLQPFTADKRLLRAVIERGKIRLRDRRLLARAETAPSAETGAIPQSGGAAAAALAQKSRRLTTFVMSEEQQIGFFETLPVLRTLDAVVSSLRYMPGRKAVVFLSSGKVPFDRAGDSSPVRERTQEVVGLANRYSVVFYALDTGGLRPLGINADSETTAEKLEPGNTLGGHAAFLQMRTVAADLSKDTGGLMFEDANELVEAMGKVVQDQKGYYLIGYAPDASASSAKRDAAREHRVGVKVKRSGLRLRSRRAFFSPYAAADATPRVTQLADATASLFTITDVPLRLTTLFNADAARGSYVHSLVHLDARRLTFVDWPDGQRKADIQTLILLLDSAGKVVDQATRSDALFFRSEAFEQVQRGGLVYALDVPVKKPGVYQVRVAARDVRTGRLGSGSDVVEIPDLREGRLGLSGIVMSAADQTRPANLGAEASGGTTAVDPSGTPAVRRFRPGARVAYALAIYNARTDGVSGQPDIDTRVSLYRDAERVASLPPAAVKVSGEGDRRDVATAGIVRLSEDMEPGFYTLVVTATDHLADKKGASAVQWIDFEVAASEGLPAAP
jgi:VWFA-related protein